MSLYVTEAEMKERYVDSLKKAASRAKEFMTAEEQEKPQLFVDFINGLKVAAGSAHQLGISQENPQFLAIRDKLETIIEVGQKLPMFNGNQAGIWFNIKTALDALADKGSKIAVAKAMPRQQVLAELTHREWETRKKNDPIQS